MRPSSSAKGSCLIRLMTLTSPAHQSGSGSLVTICAYSLLPTKDMGNTRKTSQIPLAAGDVWIYQKPTILYRVYLVMLDTWVGTELSSYSVLPSRWHTLSFPRQTSLSRFRSSLLDHRDLFDLDVQICGIVSFICGHLDP